jgi:hypothetical protein
MQSSILAVRFEWGISIYTDRKIPVMIVSHSIIGEQRVNITPPQSHRNFRNGHQFIKY